MTLLHSKMIHPASVVYHVGPDPVHPMAAPYHVLAEKHQHVDSEEVCGQFVHSLDHFQ